MMSDMTHMLLDRFRHPAPRPTQPVLEGIALARARAHEICGAARRTFAMLVAARSTGPVFWIVPKWESDRLNPDGMRDLVDPGRFTFITPRRPEDVLWALEEVLRAGCVALAVADLPGLPGLTAVRRLHLAAETGAREGDLAPLGLLLTPGAGGAPGVETRWHMAPAHSPRPRGAAPWVGTGWRLTRARARTAPVKSWMLHRQETGVALETMPDIE